MNSCGLSSKSALFVSNKFQLDDKKNTPQELESVLQFLQSHHFSDAQVAQLIVKHPQVLNCKIHNNLQPKFEYLVKIGIKERVIEYYKIKIKYYAIGRVVTVLQAEWPDSRALACTILTSLAVVEVNKATIGAYPNAIHALIRLLKYGKGKEVKEAATTLYAICSFSDNRRRAVESGAAPILVRIGGMGLERAVEVLSVLVKCKEGRDEMEKIGGCVRVLVKVIKNGSSRGIQCGLFTLNTL